MQDLIGIRATVDFVFKVLFGDRKNADLLIDLLNAVLQPKDRIVEAVILNPFNLKKFARGKVSVVDVKASDDNGKWYIIEVQTTLPVGLRNRQVYYLSSLYQSQLLESDGYDELRPAIGICFLTEALFAKETPGHTRFELHDPQHKLSLGDQLSLHFVELSKYNFEVESLHNAGRFEQWVFFLNRAHQHSESQLRKLLPDPIFQKAIGVLTMISRKPAMRMQYDDRAKEELDRRCAIADTRKAIADARQEGLTAGEAIGEASGEARGKAIGMIVTLEQVLGLPASDSRQLSEMDLSDLEKLAAKLQRRLAKRS